MATETAGQGVEKRVYEIIESQLIIDSTEITPTSLLRDDLGADSLDMVELALQLEEKFGIAPFEDSEGDKMKTVADCVKVVEKKIKDGRP